MPFFAIVRAIERIAAVPDPIEDEAHFLACPLAPTIIIASRGTRIPQRPSAIVVGTHNYDARRFIKGLVFASVFFENLYQGGKEGRTKLRSGRSLARTASTHTVRLFLLFD